MKVRSLASYVWFEPRSNAFSKIHLNAGLNFTSGSAKVLNFGLNFRSGSQKFSSNFGSGLNFGITKHDTSDNYNIVGAQSAQSS